MPKGGGGLPQCVFTSKDLVHLSNKFPLKKEPFGGLVKDRNRKGGSHF